MSELLQNKNSSRNIPARWATNTPGYIALKKEWDASAVPDGYFKKVIDGGFLLPDLKGDEYAALVGFKGDDTRSLIDKLEFADKAVDGNSWAFRSFDNEQALKIDEPEFQNWCQFKPDSARREKYDAWKKEQCAKTGDKFEASPKYITSNDRPGECFLMPFADHDCPHVLANPHADIFPGITWRLIAEVYHGLPIIIVEGAKKGAVLAAHGFIVIALPGVWMGHKRDKQAEDDRKYLLKVIAALAVENRQFYICYDNDPIWKKNTRENVGNALTQLGVALYEKTRLQPKVITWTGEEKGVDDLIAVRGFGAFLEAYENAQPLFEWQAAHESTIYGEALDIPADTRYLPELTIPPTAAKVGLVAPWGRGKTTAIRGLVEKNTSAGIHTVILQPLIKLKDKSAKEMGLHIIEEFDQGGVVRLAPNFGCVAVIDSIQKLLRYAKTKERYVVIIDEATKVLANLVLSSTAVKRDRSGNIAALRELCENAETLIASDAGLDPLTWNYIDKLKTGESYLIRDTFKYDREIIEWLDLQRMMDLGVKQFALKTSQSIFITTQSGGVGGTFGVENIAKILRKSGFTREIVEINPDSLGFAQSAAAKLFDSDPEYFDKETTRLAESGAIVIMSNVGQSGISIEAKFDQSFNFAQGVATPADSIQLFMRCRDDKTVRHYAARPYGMVTGKSSATTAKGVMADMAGFLEDRVKAFSNSQITLKEQSQDLEALAFWAARYASDNWGMFHYRDAIRGLLKKNGYKVKSEEPWLEGQVVKVANPAEMTIEEFKKSITSPYTVSSISEVDANLKQSKKEMVESRKENVEQFYTEAEKAEVLTEEELIELDRKSSKSREDRQKVTKTKFTKAVEGTLQATAKNLHKFQEESLIAKFKRHYDILNISPHIAAQEAIALEYSAKKGNYFSPDSFGKSMTAAIELIQECKFDQVLLEAEKLRVATAVVDGMQALEQSISTDGINSSQGGTAYNNIFYKEVPPKVKDLNLENSDLDPEDIALEFDANGKFFRELCDQLRANPRRCKTHLGFTPPKTRNAYLLSQLFSYVGLTQITKTSGKGKKGKYKYYLTGFNDGRQEYWQHYKKLITKGLCADDHDSISLMGMIFEKVDRKTAVTNLPKAVLAAFGKLDSSVTANFSPSELFEIGQQVLAEDKTVHLRKAEETPKEVKTQPKHKQMTLEDEKRRQKAQNRIGQAILAEKDLTLTVGSYILAHGSNLSQILREEKQCYFVLNLKTGYEDRVVKEAAYPATIEKLQARYNKLAPHPEMAEKFKDLLKTHLPDKWRLIRNVALV